MRKPLDSVLDNSPEARSFISRAALLVKVTARILPGDFLRDDAGFAAARTGQHQAGGIDSFDGVALWGVKVLQVHAGYSIVPPAFWHKPIEIFTAT